MPSTEHVTSRADGAVAEANWEAADAVAAGLGLMTPKVVATAVERPADDSAESDESAAEAAS